MANPAAVEDEGTGGVGWDNASWMGEWDTGLSADQSRLGPVTEVGEA